MTNEQTTLGTTATKLEALNRRLPQRLRPTPCQERENDLDRLAALGWNSEKLAAYILNDTGGQANAGITVHIIRNITMPPETATTAGHTTWQGHTACPDGHKGVHGQDCELCHCDPTQGPAHHIETDPWVGWPNLDLKPDNYGPGWLVLHEYNPNPEKEGYCMCQLPEANRHHGPA